jgi:hypothetical protein
MLSYGPVGWEWVMSTYILTEQDTHQLQMKSLVSTMAYTTVGPALHVRSLDNISSLIKAHIFLRKILPFVGFSFSIFEKKVLTPHLKVDPILLCKSRS